MTLVRTLAVAVVLVAGIGFAVASKDWFDAAPDGAGGAQQAAESQTVETPVAQAQETIETVAAGADMDSSRPGFVDYTPAVFAEAQSAGRTILVDISAVWCPTCRAQKPTLDELAADPALDDVVFVHLDYDTHKDFLREHAIPRQSTILIFDGTMEVGRSVAETNRDRLRSFVFDAVNM